MRHDKIQRLASDEPLAYAPRSQGANQAQGCTEFADHDEISPRCPRSRLTSPLAPLMQSHIWQAQIWRRALLRQALILTAIAALAVLLRARILALDLPAIMAALETVTIQQWALAAAATAVSYWSLGQYDAVIHRALKTQIAPRAAARAGILAIAISQTVGFGLISGALVRWRMTAGLSLAQASTITASVAASFLLGWAAITGAVLLALPLPVESGLGTGIATEGGHGLLRGLGALGVAMGMMALALPQLGRALTLFGRVIPLPPSKRVAKIFLLAALDALAAGIALWMLLPPDAGPAFTVLLPAFLLALGAGFIAGTPGGIGPFEITLLALLPLSDQTPVLAAVLAWRGIYFALPASVAAVALLRGPRADLLARAATALPTTPRSAQHAAWNSARNAPHSESRQGNTLNTLSNAARATHSLLSDAIAPPATELTPRLAALVERAPRAELGLLRQGEHAVLLAGNARAGWMMGHARRALVGLLDPFGGSERALTQALLPRLTDLARHQGKIACLYKITPRTAATARAMGWRVMPVAREAWLAPQSFTLETPALAGLRRKLRKAEKSGLRVSCAEGALPIAQMTALSDAWVAARGGERGFSMGRYTPEYASGQRVYLAYQGEELVAFATFHEGAREWVLDLMRPAAQAPDGTMHALIAKAVEDARAYQITRLSLAALPPEPDQARGVAAKIWKRAATQTGAAGLRQFKSAFAPNWQTLYLAAPNTAALTLAAASISHAIRRPPSLASGPVARHHTRRKRVEG